MLISPSELEYFAEIARTLNISRAAERLGLSQPSLSLSIQKLEASLKCQLLVRNKKGVLLTPAGRQLLAHTRQLLELWNKVENRTLASQLEVQGSFFLGCHPSVALFTLSKFLPKLLEDYPHLHLNLVHDHSRKIAADVISSKIDLGIVVNPVRHPDLILRPLYKDRVTLWHNGDKNLLIKIRRGEATLLCDQELHQTQVLLRDLKREGLQFERVLQTTSLEVIRNLTLAGTGVGILPETVAHREKPKTLKALSPSLMFQDEICFIYRIENKNVSAFKEISSRIQDAFKEN